MIDPEALGSGEVGPGQLYRRRLPSPTDHLYVTPTNAPDARAQGLHDRLFGGIAGRQLGARPRQYATSPSV